MVRNSTTVYATTKLFAPMCLRREGDYQKNSGSLYADFVDRPGLERISILIIIIIIIIINNNWLLWKQSLGNLDSSENFRKSFWNTMSTVPLVDGRCTYKK